MGYSRSYNCNKCSVVIKESIIQLLVDKRSGETENLQVSKFHTTAGRQLFWNGWNVQVNHTQLLDQNCSRVIHNTLVSIDHTTLELSWNDEDS